LNRQGEMTGWIAPEVA
jgi:hypothetical protein